MSDQGWQNPKPAFLLILGDGSYDYKAKTASGDYVPTQILFKDDPALGYYSSDNELTAVVEADHLADLVVGRLSARTELEANDLLGKILDYEQNGPAPTDLWPRHAVLITDRGKGVNDDQIQSESDQFDNINDLGEAAMKIPPHTVKRLRYWEDFCGGAVSGCTVPVQNAMNNAIKDAVHGDDEFDGAAMLQFIGHGNFHVWSDDAYLCGKDLQNICTDDTEDLFNFDRLPFVLIHNCLSGGFHITETKTMGEQWLKRDGGGAVAVYSPSGLSYGYIGEVVTETVWDRIYGPRKERVLAVPVLDNLAALCGRGSVEACQGYVLLADPATRLAIPEVGPPADVVASGGDAVVDLSWTASGTAGAVYDLYRARDADGPYTRVNGSPIPNNGDPVTYSDTTVSNATVYHYYVVALDSVDGFESRWSNFNGDCDTQPIPPDPASDCVKAEPLNPNPPDPPSNVGAVDAESGGRLDVTWNANTETDLSHYEVHYGTCSVATDPQCTAYDQSTGVIRTTSYSLTGLENGTTYYIAVTATNTSGNTSAYSIEQVEVPSFVRGLRSPGFIADLLVDRSGQDALLTWGEVTSDIYGKPATVDFYEVYRGTTPGFVPSESTRISPPGGVAVPSFTDANALAPGGPDYHWLVRAVDISGHGGGLGMELPAGVGDLVLGKSGVTPGDVVLSWSPVTTDFAGEPTVVDHYDLYVSDQPFGRTAICDPLDGACVGLDPAVPGLTATSVELTPGSVAEYYSIIVVDVKGNQSPF
jgi:hypothetical protein